MALERENPLRQPRSENRETDCSEYSQTRHSRFFSSVSNTDNNSTTQIAVQPHPLGACCLVVLQCIAFATSFLLASQTTSVAATAPCMTTTFSYTTTKLSHQDTNPRPRHSKEWPAGLFPVKDASISELDSVGRFFRRFQQKNSEIIPPESSESSSSPL